MFAFQLSDTFQEHCQNTQHDCYEENDIKCTAARCVIPEYDAMPVFSACPNVFTYPWIGIDPEQMYTLRADQIGHTDKMIQAFKPASKPVTSSLFPDRRDLLITSK